MSFVSSVGNIDWLIRKSCITFSGTHLTPKEPKTEIWKQTKNNHYWKINVEKYVFFLQSLWHILHLQYWRPNCYTPNCYTLNSYTPNCYAPNCYTSNCYTSNCYAPNCCTSNCYTLIVTALIVIPLIVTTLIVIPLIGTPLLLTPLIVTPLIVIPLIVTTLIVTLFSRNQQLGGNKKLNLKFSFFIKHLTLNLKFDF